MSNHNKRHDSKTMWLMMVFCALPLLILLFSGGLRGGSNWFTIGVIGVFIAGHFWLMRRGHHCAGHQDNNQNHAHAVASNDKIANSPATERKEHCCH